MPEKKIKILAVVGARPNFIKIVPLLRQLKKETCFTTKLIHTGQHYDQDLSAIFFKELAIKKPDYNLQVGSASHGEQTGLILAKIEKIFLKEKPSLVVVVGDVNSTLAAALAAVKLHIPIAHIEAGLRSFDQAMPEEVNRKLTDHISQYLFCTEEIAPKNLRQEGITQGVYFVGNIMIDSLKFSLTKLSQADSITNLPFKNYALLTMHRSSNVEDKKTLSKLINILEKVAQKISLVFPLHPRTNQALIDFGLKKRLIDNPNFYLTAPQSYHKILWLIKNAKLVLTDSGGIQQETTVLKAPCLTLRKNMELPVTCQIGSNTLVGHDEAKILKNVEQILHNHYKKFGIPPLWDGQTAQRIVKILKKDLCVVSTA